MKPSVRYGLILGGILVAIPLLFYALGLEKIDTLQKISGFLNVAIVASVIYMGIRETRNTAGNGFITFGSGFSTGMLISLISSAISALGTYLYFTVINPGMITYIKMKQEEEFLERGLSDADIEKISQSMEFMSTPEMMTGIAFLTMVFLGMVVSLICAGVLKKDNPAELIS